VGFAVFQLTLWFLPEILAAQSPGAIDSQTLRVDAGASGRAGALAFLACLPAAALVQPYRQSDEQYRFTDALRFSLQPRHMALLALSFGFYFSFQLVDNYLGRFWELRSGGMQLVYGGWFLAVTLEVPFLFAAARTARRSGIRVLIFAAAGAGALRFALLALAIVDTEPVPVIFTQLLHGIHFTGYHIGVIYWLRSSCPDHLYGSVYGLYNIITHSLGGMAGNVVFGTLLFSPLGPRLFEWLGGVGPPPGTVGFLPVFTLAAILQCGVIGGFLFLRAPAFRTAL
jgi:hypothetical protein